MLNTKVIAGIGISGSGKTTFLKILATLLVAIYICPDDIRDLLRKRYACEHNIPLNETPEEKEFTGEAWVLAYKKLEYAIAGGSSKYIIFDSTLAGLFDRNEILDRCRYLGVKVTGVYLDTPLEICIKRQDNPDRDRRLNAQALNYMSDNLNQDPPVREDGFHTLYRIFEGKIYKI